MTAVQSPPPPRRSHGCLWGCLGLVVILFLPVILAGAYGAWFLYDGFHHDPVMRAATEFVRQDGMARLALGEDIEVTGVEGNAFSFAPGIGSRNDYVLQLHGTKGDGTLAVSSHTEHGRLKFDAMILAGPDGQRYDILHHAALPDGGVPSESI